jgi:predicted dehydrogenase
MDPRQDRLDEAARETPLVGCYTSLEAALSSPAGYDGVVVCSPPSFHVEQSLAALEKRFPVFLEKPVSPDLASARRLRHGREQSGAILLLGYTYRWWKPLRELKAMLQSGLIGRVRHVQCVMSAHLADWHPWEPYNAFFMASRELGGGALLDESHFLDLMLWFFGMPSSVQARVEKLSDLDIQTDDNVDATLVYAGGPRVVVHLDLFGRPHEKYIRLTGETGSLHWSFEPNEIRLGRGPSQTWESTVYAGERNDMFVDALAEFVAQVAGTSPGPSSCTLDDGVAVLQLIEAMRQSSLEGRAITLSR